MAEEEDGWQVQRSRKQQPAYSSSASAQSKSMIKLHIDPELIGACIGVKGAKKHKIQELTKTALVFPENESDGLLRELLISGNEEQINKAFNMVLQSVLDFANARSSKGKSWNHAFSIIRATSATNIVSTVEDFNKTIVNQVNSRHLLSETLDSSVKLDRNSLTTTTPLTKGTSPVSVLETSSVFTPNIYAKPPSQSNPFKDDKAFHSSGSTHPTGDANPFVKELRGCLTLDQFAVKITEFEVECALPNNFCFAFAQLGWLLSQERKNALPQQSLDKAKNLVIFLLVQATGNTKRLRDYQVSQLWYGCAQGDFLSMLDESLANELRASLMHGIVNDQPDFERYSLHSLCILAWSASVLQLRKYHEEVSRIFKYIMGTVKKNNNLKSFPPRAIATLTLAFALNCHLNTDVEVKVTESAEEERRAFLDLVAKDVAIRGFVDYTMDSICQILYAFTISNIADQRILDGVEDEFHARPISSISLPNVANAAWCYAYMCKTGSISDGVEFMEWLLKYNTNSAPKSAENSFAVTVLLWALSIFQLHRKQLNQESILMYVFNTIEIKLNLDDLKFGRHVIFDHVVLFELIMKRIMPENKTSILPTLLNTNIFSLGEIQEPDILLTCIWFLTESAQTNKGVFRQLDNIFQLTPTLYERLKLGEQKLHLIQLIFTLAHLSHQDPSTTEEIEQSNKRMSILKSLAQKLLRDLQAPISSRKHNSANVTLSFKNSIRLLWILTKLEFQPSLEPGILLLVDEIKTFLNSDFGSDSPIASFEDFSETCYCLALLGLADDSLLTKCGALFSKQFSSLQDSQNEMKVSTREFCLQLLWCLSSLNKLDLRVISVAINLFIGQMEFLKVQEILLLFRCLATFGMSDSILLEKLVQIRIKPRHSRFLEDLSISQLCILSWTIGSTASIADPNVLTYMDFLVERVLDLGIDKFSQKDFVLLCSCLSRPDVAKRPSVRRFFDSIVDMPSVSNFEFEMPTAAVVNQVQFQTLDVSVGVEIPKSVEFS